MDSLVAIATSADLKWFLPSCSQHWSIITCHWNIYYYTYSPLVDSLLFILSITSDRDLCWETVILSWEVRTETVNPDIQEGNLSITTFEPTANGNSSIATLTRDIQLPLQVILLFGQGFTTSLNVWNRHDHLHLSDTDLKINRSG